MSTTSIVTPESGNTIFSLSFLVSTNMSDSFTVGQAFQPDVFLKTTGWAE
jgi:hypothetical protein